MLVLLKKRAKRSDLACRDCRDNLARIAAMDFQSSRIKSKIGGLLRVVSLQMKERRKEKKVLFIF